MIDLARRFTRGRLVALGLILVTGILVMVGIYAVNPSGESAHHSDTVTVPAPAAEPDETVEDEKPKDRLIRATLRQGETLASLFTRYNLSAQIIESVTTAAKGVLRFRDMRAGNAYTLSLDSDGTLKNFEYTVNDFSKVIIYQDPNSPTEYLSQSVPIVYDVNQAVIRGTIDDSLYRSLSETMEPARLAIDLSEIFGWDLDFNTDLKRGATYEILVEERWLDGVFAKYGRILAARLTNNGQTFQGFYYDGDRESAGYYDEKGRPLKRGFLSSPLRYQFISSRFSASRLHPILKTYRPHLGVDYAAPAGTPVSASSSGIVKFAGREGGFGKLVILKHASGYETYYGHLSAFAQGLRPGQSVSQGEVIGYVGSTGLSTGPHLDYRIAQHGRFMDPLKLKAMRAEPLSGDQLARYKIRHAELSTALREARYAVLRRDQKTASLDRQLMDSVAIVSPAEVAGKDMQ